MDPEPSQARSVLIVEDQMLLLDSLVRTINAHESLRVVGGLTSALDAVEACLRLRPDLLLMDVCTDGGASGLAACREVTTAVPATRVVLMTAMPDFSFPEQARAAGAASFIYKDVSSTELTAVLLSTAEGYSTYPARSTTPFLGYNELSDREIAVLRETCAGRTRAEIAEKFGLSENTIKSNISSILTKTGFRSITRLALYAISSGFIVVDGADTTDEGAAKYEGGARYADGAGYTGGARSADEGRCLGGVRCEDEAQGEGTAP
ncbi:response regulator transcription factor [Schaalia cardiffensis]|uniref:response regulator transcription factor n=1 Tax=Schaalia cardiffensis TaxID=181487 RepID=UPI0018E82B64|nr:response regulator transcription factor [Schaalia cardiffensis]MBJ2328806.1 response regulator transcription factor [Schaalia cardiffensis]